MQNEIIGTGRMRAAQSAVFNIGGLRLRPTRPTRSEASSKRPISGRSQRIDCPPMPVSVGCPSARRAASETAQRIIRRISRHIRGTVQVISSRARITGNKQRARQLEGILIMPQICHLGSGISARRRPPSYVKWWRLCPDKLESGRELFKICSLNDQRQANGV